MTDSRFFYSFELIVEFYDNKVTYNELSVPALHLAEAYGYVLRCAWLQCFGRNAHIDGLNFDEYPTVKSFLIAKVFKCKKPVSFFEALHYCVNLESNINLLEEEVKGNMKVHTVLRPKPKV
jgi:hypothetical protein